MLFAAQYRKKQKKKIIHIASNSSIAVFLSACKEKQEEKRVLIEKPLPDLFLGSGFFYCAGNIVGDISEITESLPLRVKSAQMTLIVYAFYFTVSAG